MPHAGGAALIVWMNGTRIARWVSLGPGRDVLEYDAGWLEDPQRFPLSLSLPLDGEKSHLEGEHVTKFFDNLLPNSSDIRARLANRFGVAVPTPFALLSAIGRDCAGAIELLPEGVSPEMLNCPDSVEMSHAQVAEHLRAIDSSGPAGDTSPADGMTVALAGAQEKTGLLELDGRWFAPRGAAATNRIVKLALGAVGGGRVPLHQSLENEWLCSEIMREFGLPIAKTHVVDFDGVRALSVERFDRVAAGSGLLARLHQEDMCQALGVGPAQKYESDGGPGFRKIVALLEGSVAAQEDKRSFLKTIVLFWMLMATDGHGKNFSIQFQPGGGYKLAPLYDVISMWPYIGVSADKVQLKKVKMAMAAVGESNNHYHWDKTQRRHFINMGLAAQVADTPEMLDNIASSALDVLNAVYGRIPSEFPRNLFNSIAEGVEKAAKKLR